MFPASPTNRIREAWFLFSLLAATVVAYLPTFHAGFIWDDDAHLTAPALRSVAGLSRIWTEPGATQQYYPLLHSLFWIEHRLWGDSALGYHVANLALHTLAAGLFALLLRRLTVPGAYLAALIFALHPLHVESVAWISEQKNTLSAVFYLGAALLWLRFDASRRPVHYWIAIGLFVLGLLTKTVVATLPAALLMLCWWRRGRVDWRNDAGPLAPWFLLGATTGLFTAMVERHLIGASGAAYDLSLLQRVLLAGRAIEFYLSKLFWPSNLTFIYPRWTIDPANALPWLPLIVIIAFTFLLWRRRVQSRTPLTVWLLFIGTLFPVLGFFNIYPFIYSFVADHFAYLASLAPIALLASALMRLPPRSRSVVIAVLLLSLGTLTWRQSSVYRSGEILYRTTIERNPKCWMAWNNLGFLQFADRSRNAEAIANFEQALRLRPAYAEAHSNLGLALTQAGRPAEAVPHLRESLRLKPGLYQVHNNLGIALASSGHADEALAAFRQAAAQNPTLPNIQENWAKALLLLGRREEAATHFTQAEKLRTQMSARESRE